MPTSRVMQIVEGTAVERIILHTSGPQYAIVSTIGDTGLSPGRWYEAV